MRGVVTLPHIAFNNWALFRCLRFIQEKASTLGANGYSSLSIISNRDVSRRIFVKSATSGVASKQRRKIDLMTSSGGRKQICERGNRRRRLDPAFSLYMIRLNVLVFNTVLHRDRMSFHLPPRNMLSFFSICAECVSVD